MTDKHTGGSSGTQKGEGKKIIKSESIPNIERIRRETPLHTRLKVSNWMEFVSLIVDLGYREDKAWTDDENELNHKITVASAKYADRIIEDIKQWENDGRPGADTREVVCREEGDVIMSVALRTYAEDLRKEFFNTDTEKTSGQRLKKLTDKLIEKAIAVAMAASSPPRAEPVTGDALANKIYQSLRLADVLPALDAVDKRVFLETLSELLAASSKGEAQAPQEEPDYGFWYWKKRCEAAEDFIAKSPCDPDITKEQIEAHDKWQHFIK